jgi:NADPH-dependent glutamate synthase beta subunit-like oxidoreductase
VTLPTTHVAIGRDITFEQLQEQFDAVAICAGAMDPVAARRARRATSTASSTASTS